MNAPTHAHTPSTANYMEKLASHVAAWRLAMGMENEGRAVRAAALSEFTDDGAIAQDVEIVDEELRELGVACSPVEEMDAILDILFATLSYATRRYTPAQIGECWAAVCAANGRKTDGPIKEGKKMKPSGWVGPEAEIAEVLNGGR